MESHYRIAAATPQLHLGDMAANAAEMVRIVRMAVEARVAAIVFPELCVTGYSCGDLFFRGDTLSAAHRALEDFAKLTADYPIVSIVAFPQREGNGVFNAAAVTYGGEIAGIVAPDFPQRTDFQRRV